MVALTSSKMTTLAAQNACTGGTPSPPSKTSSAEAESLPIGQRNEPTIASLKKTGDVALHRQGASAQVRHVALTALAGRREEEAIPDIVDDERRRRSAATGTSPKGCESLTHPTNVGPSAVVRWGSP